MGRTTYFAYDNTSSIPVFPLSLYSSMAERNTVNI